MSDRAKRYYCAAGLFCALLGLFLATNAGRIDSADGQSRYDAARGWIERGHPNVTDPFMVDGWGR